MYLIILIASFVIFYFYKLSFKYLFYFDYFKITLISIIMSGLFLALYENIKFSEIVYFIIFFIFLNIFTLYKKTKIDRLARINYEVEKKVETLKNENLDNIDNK